VETLGHPLEGQDTLIEKTPGNKKHKKGSQICKIIEI
jgi:hypothetical protein